MPAVGRRIEYQPHTAHAGLAGPRDLGRPCRTVRIGHWRAAEIERDLRWPRRRASYGCDVEAHGRRVAADSEEQIADHGGALELREVGRRDRRRHAIDRVGLPVGVGAGIDIGPQLGIEETVDQPARREQPGEVVQRDVDRRARDKRIAAGHGLLAQRGRAAAGAFKASATCWRVRPLISALPLAASASSQRLTGGGSCDRLVTQQLYGVLSGRRGRRQRAPESG